MPDATDSAVITPLRAISLGWGVQSFTLAAMAALGDIESVDVALHADTTHEAAGTYAFAQAWTPWLEAHGVRVVTVRPQEARIVIERIKAEVVIPAYTDTTNGGQIRRQCTKSWKIRLIRRWFQANRAISERETIYDDEKIRAMRKFMRPVVQLLGISLDEFQRMRDSDVRYITHEYPLVERRMTRWDCERYLETHGVEVPPKSACVFCPYHNAAAWRRMKANGGPDWQKAIDVDEAIRKVRPPYDLFLHPARIPLIDVDLRSEQDKGQLSLWDAECEGICGV